MIGLLYWQLTDAQSKLVESTALQHAEVYSEAIAAFRTIYTSEVVATARANGLIISHDYQERTNAIPLPATLSMQLGKHLTGRGSGTETHLYSPYPFPWRSTTGGLRDRFARDAWVSLSEDPSRSFYRIETQNGRRVLRYATADLMRPDCVSCHNTHPSTPRSGWKAGDLRGVLEVSYPIDRASTLARQGTRETMLIVAPVFLLAVLGLGSASVRQRRWSSELETQVHEQTTDLRSREQLLRRAKEYTDRIVGSMHDLLVVTTPRGIITRANAAATAMLGYSVDELVGMPLGLIFFDGIVFFNEEGEQGEEGLVARLRAEGVLSQRETTCQSKDGKKLPVLLSGSIVHDSAGEIEALVCVAHDITNRKQAEDYLRGILDASPVGLLVATQDGKIQRVNRTLSDMFGYTEQEIIGHPIEMLVPEQRKNIYESQGRTFARKHQQQFMAMGRELKGRRKDNTEFAAHVSLTSTSVQGQSIILAGVLDRTEYHEADLSRRRMENDIARASGMAEVATGVLHNVGNVVNSVNISAGIAQDRLRKTSLGILEDVIELLHSQGADAASLQNFLTEDPRGKRIVESLRAIAKRLRKEHSDIHEELASLGEHVSHIMAIVASQQQYATSMGVLEEVELGPFLDKAIALSGTAFSSKNMRVERRYGDAAHLTVEPHKLMQIIVNLLSNARHALAENSSGERVIQIQAEREGDDTVVISVTDNGEGIPAENLTRIFTHGFTTKTDGHGFGLHISATAAVELGGKLSVKSDGPGTGATFVLTLPTRPLKAT